MTLMMRIGQFQSCWRTFYTGLRELYRTWSRNRELPIGEYFAQAGRRTLRQDQSSADAYGKLDIPISLVVYGVLRFCFKPR